MHPTTPVPGGATNSFVDEFTAYVRRWISQQQREQAAVTREPAGPGRPCELPAEVLWSTVLLSVLQRVRGVREIWRALVSQGYDLCDQAVYARLARDGTAPRHSLFVQFSRMLAAWIQPLVRQPGQVLAPFARGVLALDETTLDPLARKLPQVRHFKKGAIELLPGEVATLFDVRLHLWRRMDYVAEVQQNCKVHARAMLTGVEKGTMLLFDLGYFGFEWLDELTSRGFWYVSRLREKTSYTLVHTLYEGEDVLDALVWLGKHQARARRMARLARVRVGGVTHAYLTNVLDPTLLPDGTAGAAVCAQVGYGTGVLAAQGASATASVVAEQADGHLATGVGLSHYRPTRASHADGDRRSCAGGPL